MINPIERIKQNAYELILNYAIYCSTYLFASNKPDDISFLIALEQR